MLAIPVQGQMMMTVVVMVVVVVVAVTFCSALRV
jgi:hypothetical protein